MNERKIRRVILDNVSKNDFEFIVQFGEKSKEVLEHLIKTPHGVLEIDYIDTNRYYQIVQVIVKPS